MDMRDVLNYFDSFNFFYDDLVCESVILQYLLTNVDT
jgi:hypothetical protein